MKIFFTLFLFVVLFLSLQKTNAQSPEWINYTSENSLLPTNTLNHIVVDNENRKWIATECNGLVKIDESGWHIFNTNNSQIPSDCISSIAADNNQDLWIGGWNQNFKLAKFDGSNWSVWGTNNSPLVYNYVNSITFDSTNKIWLQSSNPENFGTANHLFSFDGDTTWNNELSFTSLDGWRKVLISGDSIIIAATDYNGKLIVLKDDGTSYDVEEFVGTYVTDLKEDSAGNIWIAAGLAGWGYLYKYDGTSFTGFPQYTATAIQVDKANNLWIGTESGFEDSLKLVKYNGTDWTEYTAENSPLPQVGSITDLTFDQFGNLWITTVINGVYIFNENGITPVELISFSAEVNDNNVILKWITESETNNQGFEIEKCQTSNVKRQNEEWKKISFVEGNGTTTEQQYYSYTDNNLKSGKYKYRLKQIDLDGSFEYSNIVEAEVGLPLEFSLSQNYPNPFNPSTKIKYSIPGSTDYQSVRVKLIVYDVLGKEVAPLLNEEKQPGVYEVDFNASILSSGIYFYKLTAGNFVKTKKMILLR